MLTRSNFLDSQAKYNVQYLVCAVLGADHCLIALCVVRE